MGVRILLFVKGDGIGSDLWERVYAESLVLLRNFPAPLMHLAVENMGDEKRYSLTADIVQDRGTREERWTVDGDMRSRAAAESFELHRYHDRQFPADGFFAAAVPNSEDVLWAEPTDERHDIHGNGRMVWNSKTQGLPYHYAILAVGMLVESRCPGRAYVTGDIDLSEAEEVRQWADPLLEEPLALPVCFDPDRLYERLSPLYEEEEHVVSRASGLYLGSDSELYQAVVRHAGSATADAWFKERLGDFDCLSHVGASELVTSFLEATGNTTRLVKIMQELASARARETEECAGFSLNGLLHELCSRFITIPLETRNVLETHGAAAAAATAAALKRSDEVIFDAFLRIAKTPSPLPVYVPADELLELFSQADPEQRDQFAETIHTEERNCRKTLAGFADARAVVNTSSEEHGSSGALNSGTAGDADPIRAEIARQTVHYEAEESSTRELGEMLRSKLMSAPVVATPRTRGELLAELYRVTRIHGIALTETAWNRIDALRDDTVLRHLLALAAIKHNEIHFCEARLHVLESAQLWPVLAGAA